MAAKRTDEGYLPQAVRSVLSYNHLTSIFDYETKRSASSFEVMTRFFLTDAPALFAMRTLVVPVVIENNDLSTAVRTKNDFHVKHSLKRSVKSW